MQLPYILASQQLQISLNISKTVQNGFCERHVIVNFPSCFCVWQHS